MAAATLASSAGNDLFAWCFECRRGGWLDKKALEQRYGADVEIPALAERLRCSSCGQAGTSGITLHATAATSSGR